MCGRFTLTATPDALVKLFPSRHDGVGLVDGGEALQRLRAQRAVVTDGVDCYLRIDAVRRQQVAASAISREMCRVRPDKDGVDGHQPAGRGIDAERSQLARRADRHQQEALLGINRQSARLAVLHLAVAPVRQLSRVSVEAEDGDALLGGDRDEEEGVGRGGGRCEERAMTVIRRRRVMMVSCDGDVSIP
jgi:hypothetical protein